MRAVLAAAVVLLAACSSSSDAEPGTSAPAPSTTAATTTVDGSSPPTAPDTTAPDTTAPVSSSPVTDSSTSEPATTDETPPTPSTDAPTTESAPGEPETTNASVPDSAVTAPTDAPGTTVAGSPDRPFDVFVPSTYDPATPMPLVMLLHGYTASGLVQSAYFGLQPVAEARGFLFVAPDGTTDPRGNRFWNATDACCDLFGSAVDDSTYLLEVIDAIKDEYNVDPSRVYLVGHSNGGFMSYRMACDHADVIAAIVSVAGATFADTSRCAPSEPVSVLEIHGTADATIEYDGASILSHTYPGATTSVQTWATYDGCTGAAQPTGETLDLVSNLDGAETSVQAVAGCPAGVDVDLWTVDGGPHVPALTAEFPTAVVDFLFAHPKPG